MALTTEQIDAEAFARWGDMKGAPLAMCRGFARAIEAEVRKDDEALIRQLVEALEGYRRNHNDNQPCDAERAARARLLEADLAKLTERGAKAWAGVDEQKLREDGTT